MTTTHTVDSNAWTGRLGIDDTELAVTDLGGTGRPVLFLNGCFAAMTHWNKVLDGLDRRRYRAVLFDERARGKSGTSSDYSFAGCLRDIQAVITARQIERPILVGWSYGAYIGVHHAAAHPSEVTGVVCVDGALPFGLTGEEGRAELRRLFKRVSWALPVASRLGFAARMSGEQHAEVNIEGNEVAAHVGPVLNGLEVPTRYVLGTGGHLGASAEIMAECRATLNPVMAANPNVTVFRQVPCNHTKILARFPDVILGAVNDVASAAGV